MAGLFDDRFATPQPTAPPSLSPADYLLMRSMNYSPDATAMGSNYIYGPIGGFYKQYVDGPHASEMGGAYVNGLPFLGVGTLGVNANYQRDPSQGWSIAPGVNATFGPFSANYSHRVSGGAEAPVLPGVGSSGAGDSYGVAVNAPLGNQSARLNFQQMRPANGAPASNTFGLGMPVAGGSADFSATQGGVGGPRYQGGFSLPSFFGGELSAGGTYAPDRHDVSAFAKYRRTF